MCAGKIKCRITLSNLQTVLARKTGHLIQPSHGKTCNLKRAARFADRHLGQNTQRQRAQHSTIHTAPAASTNKTTCACLYITDDS